MYQLLWLILWPAAAAVLLRRKMAQTVPPAFLFTLLFSYILSLAGLMEYMVVLHFILGSLLLVLFYLRAGGGDYLAEIKRILRDPVLYLYLCTIVIICFAYRHHEIVHWDDFNYWATYAKNIIALDRLPVQAENCTIYYKDYFPAVQTYYYWFLKGMPFSDQGLFIAHMILFYSLLLPLLGELVKAGKKLLLPAYLGYLIFPHLFMIQFYNKLGVDCLLSLMFAYAVYCAVRLLDGERDSIVGLYLSLAAMAVTKSSGIVLSAAGFLVGTAALFSSRRKGAAKPVVLYLKSAMMLILPLCLYQSWNIFCKITNNQSDLHDKVRGNIKEILKLEITQVFPDYSLEVIGLYLKAFFTKPLHAGSVGLSAALVCLFIWLVYGLARKRRLVEPGAKRIFWILTAGQLFFCLGHLYMYLFVFYDWEALGLLEYDRYICQYLIGYLAFALILLQRLLQSLKGGWKTPAAFACLAAALCLVNWPAGRGNFTRAGWEERYQVEIKAKQKALQELAASGIMEIPPEKKLLLVGSGWTEEIQYLTYLAVPRAIAFVTNTPAIEAGRLADFLETHMERFEADYVYFLEDAKSSYPGDFEKELAPFSSGGQLAPGRLYRKTEDGRLALQ